MASIKKIVISASRRTDIPAFYMNDFMNDIHRGFFRVTNPFNQKESLVMAAPDRIHTIVFWSKDYTNLIRGKFIEKLRELGYNLFFNYTINSHDSILEPCIASLEHRLTQLETLTQIVGPEAIFWRFDPICYYRRADGKICHNRHDFLKIADAASDLGIQNCITSFVDIYTKVQKRLSCLPGFSFMDPPLENKIRILQEMAGKLKKRNITLLTCCEKQLLEFIPRDSGIKQASCIPNQYLAKLYGSDISLRKDAGQRIKMGCGCRISVDVGSYRHQPCYHNCLFCYANPGLPGKKSNNEN
jgi:DNA repair photolyase